jgi:hypothetical protein
VEKWVGGDYINIIVIYSAGDEPRMIGKYSTTELSPQLEVFFSRI